MNNSSPLSQISEGQTILLGIGASVAAYKGIEVLRGLRREGLDVWVCPTPASLDFVGQATWESLSSHPTMIDTASGASEISHITLAQQAAAIVTVGASADLMARFAAGMGNDFLTLVTLAATCPNLIAPAMHPSMWENAATQANYQTLRDRGWQFIGPVEGEMADGSHGIGRLANPGDILAAVVSTLHS